jgi:peptidylprolyl isomerase
MRITRRRTAALFALVATAAPVLPAAAQVIGKAGAVELTEADVRRLVSTLPADSRSVVVGDDAALEQVVRAELARRALLNEIRGKGFDRDPAALQELDRLKDDALVRLWLERNARIPDGYPSESEVAKVYDAARQRAPEAADVHLAQIFIAVPDGAPQARVAEALRKAGEVQSKLAGADFGQLARQYSEHAESAQKGGDLGLVPDATLIPEVRLAVADAKPGAVVGPLKTAQGFHFVKLLERKPTPAPALSQVRDRLVAALRQQKAAETQREYLTQLGRTTSISVNQVELGRVRASLK